MQEIKEFKFNIGRKQYTGRVLITDEASAIADAKYKNLAVAGYEHDGLRLDTKYIVTDIEELDESFLIKVFCRQNGLPLAILETDRCYVRELKLSDLSDLFALYGKEGITDYVEPLFSFDEELNYQKDYIQYIYEIYEYGMWLVFDKETNALIGRIGIEARSETESYDRFADSVELGYILAPEYQHRGIAYEVSEAVLKYAKEHFGFLHFTLRADLRNMPSVRLAERLGFQNTGIQAEKSNEMIFEKYLL